MVRQPNTQWPNHHDGLRLVLPSDGDLYEGCLAFLRACGLPVERQRRRYTADIPAVKGAVALFQRTADITQKVEEGSAELGVVGFDRFLEYRREGTPAVCLVEDLGFGRCDLVVAVPDAWLDVTSVNDLADLAVEFRQQGRQMRIATKYPRLVQRYLYSHGIYYFTLVQASGSLEAAPAAGYADLSADLVSSGMTLRDNQLKTLDDGTILESSACLIGNRGLLQRSERTLQMARAVLETIEGHLKARSYFRITANVRGASAEAIGADILSRPDLAGLQGPTVSRVFNLDDTDWYAVSLLVPRESLLEAVDHLRSSGARDIAASQVSYLFRGECDSYRYLLESGGSNEHA